MPSGVGIRMSRVMGRAGGIRRGRGMGDAGHRDVVAEEGQRDEERDHPEA